ncbi:MAG: AI-2E family transporter [Candidatus Promineifilaceae bacterium]
MNARPKGRNFFFLLFAILILAVLIILRPYLGVIAIALIAVTLLKPIYDRFMRHHWVRGRTQLATTMTLLTFFLIIVIPGYVLGSFAIAEANQFLTEIQSIGVEQAIEELTATINDFISQIPLFQDVVITVEKITELLIAATVAVVGWIVGSLGTIGASLTNLVIGGIIFLVVVATMLPTLDRLGEQVKQLSPLDVNITQTYLSKSREMVFSVVKGVFLIVILQGLLMGFFYWLAGIPFTVFWTLLSMAFGILPVVGISFVAWFLAIISIITGNTASAVIILLGFYVVVNPLDLILRPRLVSKEAYLNFSLMLLALFGGLAVGGLLGMIYGPVFMILLVSTIEIYLKYFAETPAVAAENAESGEIEPLSEQAEVTSDEK